MTALIRDRADGFEIRLAAPRAPVRIVALGTGVAFWAWGEWFAAAELAGAEPGSDASLLRTALVLWTVGGALVVWRLLASLFARDRLVVAGGTITLAREVFGIGRRRRVPLASVTSVAVAPPAHDLLDLAWGVRVWGVGGTALAFEVDGERMRWAEGIDEADAGELVGLLHARGVGARAQPERLTAST